METPVSVTVDPAGYVYITGQTASSDFPSTKRFSPSHAPGTPDLFVAKIDPAGGTLLYSIVIGGSQPAAIAVDAAGAVYVAGTDSATDFPTGAAGISSTGRCFLLKLDAAGANLVYATRLGCTGYTTIPPNGLTVDAGGNAYLTGSCSGAVPTTPGALRAGSFGPFAMKVNAQGTSLAYSTYLPAGVSPRALALDVQGNVYITGSGDPTSFPAPVHKLPSGDPAPTDSAFVMKLSAGGSKSIFTSVFGGNGSDYGAGIVLGHDGSIYVTGSSHTTTGLGNQPFPTTDGALDTFPGFPRGFLAHISEAGDALLFSTFLPGGDAGQCLAVRDTGVDVLATVLFPGLFPNLFGSRLLRIGLDGSSLISTAITSTMAGTICGQGGGQFVLAAPGDPAIRISPAVTSPDLHPLGPGGRTDVWFSAVDADAPGAPLLDINTGELRLRGWIAADGSHPAVTQVLHVEAGGRSVPLRIFPIPPAAGGAAPVSVSPSPASTPADVTVTALQGGYTDRLTFFAPGAQNGLQVLPLSMIMPAVNFAMSGLSGSSFLALNAPDGSTPVSATVHLDTTVTTDVFGATAPTPLNFTVAAFSGGALPPWLKIDPASGVTPADITFTANPAAAAAPAQGIQLQFLAPGQRAGQPGNFTLEIDFRIGQAPAPAPVVIPSPASLTFRLTPDAPSVSAPVHLESSGDPIAFRFDPTPEWLKVSPASGTTPADLTITAAPATLVSGVSGTYLQFRDAGGAPSGFLPITLIQKATGYVGILNPTPMSTQPFQVFNPYSIAPGALFSIGMDAVLPDPAGTLAADPGSLVTTLGGYSFQVNGIPVPLRSVWPSGRGFLAQMPFETAPGAREIDAFDAGGNLVATGKVNVAAASPQYLELLPNGSRAQKLGGGIVDASNPVVPGDSILVRLTGQGAVRPPVPSGQAAGGTAIPAQLLTATIGGKAAPVLSAAMSATEAGVLEVWLQVPDLYPGDHMVSISIGPLSAGILPIKVAAP